MNPMQAQQTCLISIIIPVYNVEKYLSDCLNSVLMQDLSSDEYEIVCVNDGSTDLSQSILDTYARMHQNIVVIQKENRGVSSARNVGLKNARGKYVWFIDSDDCIVTDCLQGISLALKQYDPDMLSFPFDEVAENYKQSRSMEKFVPCVKESTLDKDLVLSASVCINIIRKALMEQHEIVFDENMKYGEDTLFQFQVWQHISKIVIMDNCIYHYRIREDSSDHNTSQAAIDKKINAYSYVIQCINEYLQSSDVSQERKANALFRKNSLSLLQQSLFPASSYTISEIGKVLRKNHCYNCRLLWTNLHRAKGVNQKISAVKEIILLGTPLGYAIYVGHKRKKQKRIHS